MRGILYTVAVLSMTGCAADQVAFSHTAKIESQTRGVAMLDDAQHANVGMMGNTCMVDVGTGAIPVDVDVAQGEEDLVVDAFDGQTLVVGTGGVFAVTDGTYSPASTVTDGFGVADARLTSDGVVTVQDGFEGCQVAFADGTTTAVDGDCSSASIAVDRAGTLFVANDAGVQAVSRSGATPIASGDLVSFDEVLGQAYVATRGAGAVEAIGADGTAKWSLPVDGRVVSMDDMGDMGAVGVMTTLGAAGGEFLVVDGTTGDILSTLQTPAGEPNVVVAPDAKSMAFVLRNEVHFLAIHLD